MPFIGRDWRSPGEAWVKTESSGWQRMKIIESQLYPTCHQNPACSWPPRSDFGQHMANHCTRGHDRNDRNSSELRSSLSSGSSSDSSRGGSMSPSPTGSPEKNVHHLYPITISSPYGQYSCCAHHFDPCLPANNYYEPRTDNSQQNAQTMSRSLSRESVRIDNATNNRKLRYNNSVPDFRNTSSTSSVSDQNFTTDTPASHVTNNNKSEVELYQSKEISAPILMKNGNRLDDIELLDCEQGDSLDNNNADTNKARQSLNSQTSTCCCTNTQVSQNLCHPKEPYVRTAPHCRISVRTREVAMYNTISEAFYRLDFCNAIHDIRRFDYICKLLHLLITQNLTSLSGCATKVLFTMLEQVAWEVSSNKRNIHVLKNLLNELRQMIQKYYCWGRPIGSSLLWQQHFDTIERISQIVDEIELSPPKNDSTQITFNNLPVEMIREILLRLNDYRDLVNSAQASPVMRNMVDGQDIWKQLCRYHFNEQQLKSAFESQNGLFAKKSTIRGVKYARTASADGRTSFRNPVTHKPKGGSTTKQQIEQTSGRRGSRQNADESGSSYVTRAIRIFDKEGSSMTLGTSRVKKNTDPEYLKRDKQSSSQNLRSNKDQEVVQQNRPLNSNRSSNENDWERVFHQLRKKFDLKEEYADCLLLCRHCRCLFWKSFGHPCIKNDDSLVDGRQSSGFRFDRPCSVGDSSNAAHNVCNCDGLNRQNGLTSQEQELGRVVGRDQVHSRLSVAALSRNFDNRAQGLSRANDVENIPPQSSVSDGHNAHQPSNQRLISDNLDARLRERNVRVANRSLDESNGINRNNNSQASRPAMRRDELVPKHVAISPQAFLKFFSL